MRLDVTLSQPRCVDLDPALSLVVGFHRGAPRQGQALQLERGWLPQGEIPTVGKTPNRFQHEAFCTELLQPGFLMQRGRMMLVCATGRPFEVAGFFAWTQLTCICWGASPQHIIPLRTPGGKKAQLYFLHPASPQRIKKYIASSEKVAAISGREREAA